MEFLIDGPGNAPATVLLAHGAGAGMESATLAAMAQALAREGLRVVRFEFAYMAARREGRRRPPPRAEALVPEYEAAVAALGARAPLVVGGKSMGGRVASLMTDDLHAAGKAAGLLCLGYPFHPPKQLDRLRTAHLATLQTPALIVQGSRDPFGSREEVAGYALAPQIAVHWLEDGDHDLKPRASSGFTTEGHLATMAETVAAWARDL